MQIDELGLKRLKNLRKKWRTEATRQDKFRVSMQEKGASLSAEKSCGMWIGYESCANEPDKLIREMERGES